MKLGIIGLPQSGKSTIFAALTGARGEGKALKTSRKDQRIGVVRVTDERVDFLSKILKPQKTTYASVEYLLPSEIPGGAAAQPENVIWSQVRACDSLIHVVRNFETVGGMPPSPEADFWRLEEEMILYDLMVVEKRIERIELDDKRGKKPDKEEYSLLRSCQDHLENSQPLRIKPELASAPALRGFTFLSAKPQLIIINNDDEDEAIPEWKAMPEKLEMLLVRGRLEMEIAAMSPEEAEEFLVAYHIEKSALDRVIMSSYSLMNLISFFTVVHDEVRAWTITSGASALKAAGTVHSDMEKGFIRAEVLSFEHLKAHGSFQEAKKGGDVHLEGKEYIVQDGDVINFRFNI
jgi:GTP-binding protein YchF